MNHHVGGGNPCPLCEEKLSGVHDDLQRWFRSLIKPRYNDAHISWGYRNQADQELAFSQGKSHEHFPNSPHNQTENDQPCSLAVDLFQLSDGKALWPYSFFAAIDQYNLSQKLPIKWGGQFKSLGDFDHFQLIFPV